MTTLWCFTPGEQLLTLDVNGHAVIWVVGNDGRVTVAEGPEAWARGFREAADEHNARLRAASAGDTSVGATVRAGLQPSVDRQRRVQLAEAMFAAARRYERDEALRLAGAIWPHTTFVWRPSTGQVAWPSDHCRHPDCRDTNWGGHNRVHARDDHCPPDEVGRHLDVRMQDVP